MKWKKEKGCLGKQHEFFFFRPPLLCWHSVVRYLFHIHRYISSVPYIKATMRYECCYAHSCVSQFRFSFFFASPLFLLYSAIREYIREWKYERDEKCNLCMFVFADFFFQQKKKDVKKEIIDFFLYVMLLLLFIHLLWL